MHPFTKEIIPAPFRMAAFAPVRELEGEERPYSCLRDLLADSCLDLSHPYP